MPDTASLQPARIFAEIEAQPMPAREQAKAAYVGKEVDWVLRLADGWEEEPGSARLAFRYQPNEVKFVSATVPLSDCPWLKHLHAGEVMRVRGRIAELGSLAIRLKGATVTQLVTAA